MLTKRFNGPADDAPEYYGPADFLDYVHNLSGDTAWLDDEQGTVDYGPGWHGRIGRRVLRVDSLGFRYVDRYPTVADAESAMRVVAAEYDALDDADGES